MPDKSVVQKLLIKENCRLLLLYAPESYRAQLGKLLSGVTVLTEPSGTVDLIQAFITSKTELEAVLKKIKPNLKPASLIWLTYPKGTSKTKTDINRDSIREYVEKNGFKTVALVAVDDTWSALRLKVI